MEPLRRLQIASDRYAKAPVADAFTWDDAGGDLGDGEWYLVAFRSVRRRDVDEARLWEIDELAHQEAAASPGFVHYFKGPLADDLTCLSFCLWDSRADARAAAAQPAHLRAMSLLNEMYESYTLEFHRVERRDGGRLTFEPYDQPGRPQHVHVTGPELHPRAGLLRPAEGPAPA